MRKLLPAAAALLAAGCGYVGEPLPPLANVPGAVTDLAATQQGNRILVHFTVPGLTTEGVPIKTPLQFDLRIGPASEPFDPDQWAAAATPIPGGAVEKATAQYEIPSTAWTGKEMMLGVRAIGPNGKESKWSNFFALLVVAPPERPTNLRADLTQAGVRITWQARGNVFRVLRREGAQEFHAVADVEEPQWLDTTTEPGKQYSYEVQSVVKLANDREAESDLSAEATIVPRDITPPAVPQGLRAAAAPNSIELSWERNAEPDLAGYRVYRAEGGGPFAKVADVGEVPAWSDHDVQRGHNYRYAVSAVDRTGNESARSEPQAVTFE